MRLTLAMMSQFWALAMVTSGFLAKASISVEPNECTATQRHGRRTKPLAASLRLTISSSEPSGRGGGFRGGKGAIGEDTTQPGKGRSDRTQEYLRTVAVLNIRGVDDGGDQQPRRVVQDMVLAALDLSWRHLPDPALPARGQAPLPGPPLSVALPVGRARPPLRGAGSNGVITPIQRPSCRLHSKARLLRTSNFSRHLVPSSPLATTIEPQILQQPP